MRGMAIESVELPLIINMIDKLVNCLSVFLH